MILSKALQYPFQGKGWLNRILILALVQLVPVVGQLILVGYGLDAKRSIYAGQTDLPPIRWRQTVGDGLRLLAAGLLFFLPILAVAPMILTAGTSQVDSGAGGGSSLSHFIFPVVLLIVLPSLSRVVKSKPKLKTLVTGLGGLMMVVFVGSTVWQLVNMMQSDLRMSNLSLNAFGTVQLIVLLLFSFVIFAGLQVGGLRYAVEGKGLFQPTPIIQLMLSQRRKTVALIFIMILLDVLAILAIGLGLLLLVLPGLGLFVTFSLAQWHLFAQYGMEIGLNV